MHAKTLPQALTQCEKVMEASGELRSIVAWSKARRTAAFSIIWRGFIVHAEQFDLMKCDQSSLAGCQSCHPSLLQAVLGEAKTELDTDLCCVVGPAGITSSSVFERLRWRLVFLQMWNHHVGMESTAGYHQRSFDVRRITLRRGGGPSIDPWGTPEWYDNMLCHCS